VERKSLADLVTSLTSGKLKFALAELAALPRAAVVVEDRYSQIFKLTQAGPSVVADQLAEVQVRWPNVPMVFCETRKLPEEWVCRYLAAAHIWREPDQPAAADPRTPEVSTAEIRARARRSGITVPDRGRLRPEVLAAYLQTHAEPGPAHRDVT